MSRVVDARACVTSRIVAVLPTERAGRFCWISTKRGTLKPRFALGSGAIGSAPAGAFAMSDRHHGVNRLSEALVRDADHRGRVEPLSAHTLH